MADYKGIKGFKVQYLSADPSNPIIGQTWYNDTSKDLKYTGVTTAGTWATGNNMNTARATLAGAGIQTAALAFGGYDGTANTGATEEYDGTNWTTTRKFKYSKKGYKRSRYYKQQDLLLVVILQLSTGATEEYDGNSWTSSNPLNTARAYPGGTGTQTAGLAFGGFAPGSAATEEYDGNSWTSSKV
jgi:hypothetical protein